MALVSRKILAKRVAAAVGTALCAMQVSYFCEWYPPPADHTFYLEMMNRSTSQENLDYDE